MLACAIIFIDSFFVLFQFVGVTLIMTKISKNDSGSKASCIRGRMINAGVSSFCAFVLILILLCESFFLFRSKLLIILLLFLQSFCFIVNHLTSEPFFFHYLMMHLFCDIFREECFWLGSFSVVGFIYAFISKFFLFFFVMEGVGLN